MANSNYNLFILVLLAISTAGSLGDHLQHSDHQLVPLFVFGDSIFDVGNNNYINTTTSFQANFWPYGETYFKHPTGRFSDGRLIPDFIAEHAKLPLIPPYLQPGNHQFSYGVNFASAGAGCLSETWPGLVINLKTQLGYFKNVQKQLMKKLGDKEAKTLLSKTVYLFSIGSNDYFSPFISNSSIFHAYSQEEYVEMVIGNLTTVIKEIYRKGGRNFGFLNLGQLGCVPLAKALIPGNTGDQCLEDLNTPAKLHNKALSKVLHKLERELEGFLYSYFDFYSVTKERISKYGFKEVNSACCGSGPYRGVNSCGGNRGIAEFQLCPNPSEYMFFDGGHFTEKAYQQIAKLIWSGTTNIAWPYNLKELFRRGQD